MNLRLKHCALLCLVQLTFGGGLQQSCGAVGPQAAPRETAEQRDARMAWWREARFGMFVHWGLYAVPAGTWNDKQIPGIGEWIMDRANIPRDEYRQLAKQFNPVRYDPARWVQIAKEAGMKYIVITAKHHDGFCLFETNATDYDVVDATPYGKDLLVPLAAQCRKQGLKFCVYYSIMDWNHPSQSRGSPSRYNPTKMEPNLKQDFLAYMKTQLKELLASCDPAVLWFDGEWPKWWTAEDGWELYHFLKSIKPSLIVKNRIGKGRKGMEGLDKTDRQYAGDFGTPEQQIPATGLPGVDWESCMTMNETWGYKSYDHQWKSSKHLTLNLVDIASKGGNFLLNVGPKADGTIPGETVGRLKDIGSWMQINAESIHGTTASPCGRPGWGRVTSKSLDHTPKYYFHVFDWPADGRISAPIDGKVAACYLLADKSRTFATSSAEKRLTVELSGTAPGAMCSVVVVETAR